VLVAMVNHANAGAARPVLDALIDWVAQDDPAK
jgi:D-alanyl-D-alanine carboxypeptidase/D-alanyl-D-alanine-endopeptidase (penicillin-binding protein 4)